jgi:O-antigen ligase
VLLSAILVGGLALMVFPVPPLFEKWRLLPEQWNTAYPRFEAMRACLEICRDAGAWGFGSGTFASIFPHYAQEMAVSARGVWRHAHCDYLEWFIEWGYFGFLLWGFVPLGALVRVARRFLQEKSTHRRSEAACTGAALVALGLHALADFPVFNPGVQMLVVFWLGSAWSVRSSVSGTSVKTVQNKRRTASKGAAPRMTKFGFRPVLPHF